MTRSAYLALYQENYQFSTKARYVNTRSLAAFRKSYGGIDLLAIFSSYSSCHPCQIPSARIIGGFLPPDDLYYSKNQPRLQAHIFASRNRLADAKRTWWSLEPPHLVQEAGLRSLEGWTMKSRVLDYEGKKPRLRSLEGWTAKSGKK